MKNDIKIGQIALLLIIPGGKLLALPSLLSKSVGHDSYVVLAIMFAIDVLCVAFFAWALKLNTSRYSLGEILSRSTGRVISKVLLVLLLVLMLARIVVISSSCYKLFSVTFSVQASWPAFVIPLVMLGLFAVKQGFKSVARVNELLFGVVVVAFVSLMVAPVKEVDFSELLPFCEYGSQSIVKACIDSTFWFTDYVFLYFVMKDVNNGKVFPVVLCFAIGAVLAVFSNAVFVALYGDTAQVTDLAMSKISLFATPSTTQGRWDWLSVSLWSLSVLVRIVVYIYSSYECIKYLFELHSPAFNYFVALPIVAVMFLPMLLSAQEITDFVTNVLKYPFAVVQYVLPLFLPWFVKVANVKAKGVTSEQS